jgi:hypothetical protein
MLVTGVLLASTSNAIGELCAPAAGLGESPAAAVNDRNARRRATFEITVGRFNDPRSFASRRATKNRPARGERGAHMNARFRSCVVAVALLCAAVGTRAAGAAPAGSPTAWPWPAIPSCLADPSTATAGRTDYASPVCSVYDALLGSAASGIEFVSARRLNAEFDGVLYPAFLPGTEVVRFVPGPGFVAALGAGNALVRVSRSAAGARYGSWWTTLAQLSDARGLLPAERLRAILALTDSPACVAYASGVAPGVRGFMGVVAPAFNEPGGAVEFWFPPDSVTAARTEPLPGTPGC